MDLVTTDFENWGPYLMKQFQMMYEKGERCDLEITCKKEIFLVHRLIMSACSDYVRDLTDKQHIILPEEVSCKALKTVIDFVYSGKIVFNRDEKDDLLLAASLLNMRLLTELIKMEESCSFTLSMDDEGEDQSINELNDGSVNTESGEHGSSQADHKSTAAQVPCQVATKRRSESRRNSSRSTKNNVVLPPLHKFPYLQQKFSASRTYGLITNLTEPVPSRFAISDAELLSSAYRSTFEDVTYETEKLFKDADCLTTLEDAHRDFLKKLKDTTSNRRCYSNALYSPFDKYTPPYNLNSEPTTNRRRESAVSYPAKTASASVVTAYGRKTKPPAPVPAPAPAPAPAPTPTTVLPPAVTLAPVTSKPPVSIAKPNRVVNNATKTTDNSVVVEKHVRFADIIDIHEVDMDVDEPDNDFDALPKPVSPVPPELVQVPSSIESGEKVELIKLHNAVPTCVTEELPDVSISVINGGTNDAKTTAELKEETSDRAEVTVAEPPYKPSTTPAVLDDCVAADAPLPLANDIVAQSMEEAADTGAEFECDALTAAPADASVPTLSSVQRILTDTSVFTPLNTSNAEVSEPHSQMFALKVKGTENEAQLHRLVDLCKKNPLFKNKNVSFKIVPVKGPIPETLKEQSRVSSAIGINKAIIVRRTENSKPPLSPEKNRTAVVNSTATEVKKTPKYGSIDNVNGPWECAACSEQPLTFGTYADYRTHLHAVHKEGNNPIYCPHCGYKSLKRNMQLYHLFTKHKVAPPSHVKFPKCDQCEFHALNQYYLQKHSLCHPTAAGLEYVCSCKVAFKSSELLQKHMVSGDCKNPNSFTCGYCRCVFDRFVNLKAHMRICMKERSKPGLQSNPLESFERPTKTVSDGGKDYLAL